MVYMNDFIHHHHHHPEGVVYRSFCLNSSTFAVSQIASRRWWCIESLCPGIEKLRTKHLKLTFKLETSE